MADEKKGNGKLPPAEKIKTREVIAKLLGRSPRTLDKVEKIVDAAKADPGQFS